MKRHESIVILSREHHFGLLFCWKLRQGIKKDIPAERMQPYVSYFWKEHLQSHFEEEEIILFANVQDDLVKQAMAEHLQISQAIKSITESQNVSVESLRQLADMLDNHIRFEERVLFPHLEQTLTANQLSELGKQLSPTVEKDDYADEFWV